MPVKAEGSGCCGFFSLSSHSQIVASLPWLNELLGAGLCLGQGWELPRGSGFSTQLCSQVVLPGSFRASVCDKLRSTCLEVVKILQQLINLLYLMMFAVPPRHPEDLSSLIQRV